MGTQFFWFYDVLVVGIILAVTFRCYKKGFISVIVGFASILAAFFLSAFLSEPVSVFVYDRVVGEQIAEYINGGIDGMGGGNTLYELSKVDADKIKVNGIPVTELDTELDSAGKITLDISNLDFSDTGLSGIDLTTFGIDSESTDFSKVNAGKVNITANELKEHSTGSIVMSKALAQAMCNETSYGAVAEMVDNISKNVPFFDGGVNINDKVAKIIRAIIEADSEDMTDALIDGMVKPMVMPVLRSVVFFPIFITALLLFSLLTRALKLVNRVPVIGRINSFFGAVVGVFNGFVIVALVCVFIHIIIALTGNTIVLLNNLTIENTIIFKYIYNQELLSSVVSG